MSDLKEKADAHGIKIKRSINPVVCCVIEKDIACYKVAKTRNACNVHYSYCSSYGFRDLLPNSAIGVTSIMRILAVKKNPDADICKVIDDGVACDALPKTNGMCRAHGFIYGNPEYMINHEEALEKVV